jgi:type II secretory pathway pseudopilin PulG
MVVVVIVSILTILAVPSLSAARMDQTAYGDAGAITQLFRSARTRAIGWGAAMLISATASAADRGTFMLYQNTIGGVPSTTCGPPTDWSGAAAGQLVTVIDGVNLNGNAEADASLQATVLWPAGAGPGASQNSLFVCFTPLGRSYIYAAGTIRTPTMFSGVTLSYSPIEIDVQRSGINTVRAVLVPQTGMARLFSKVP